MSGSPAIEIDFFSRESSPKKFPDHRRDIQGMISKINPELLKTAIASASANKSSSQQLQTLPVYNQGCGGVKLARSSAPLTIFYNGIVSVFDVSPNQAENIMKLAESVSSGSETVVESTELVKHESNQIPARDELNKDLPLSRKKSLRRFLEKRKERQVSISPYAYSQGNTSLH